MHSDVNIYECVKKCEDFGTQCRSFNTSESEKKCFLHDIVRSQTTKANYIYRQGYVNYRQI